MTFYFIGESTLLFDLLIITLKKKNKDISFETLSCKEFLAEKVYSKVKPNDHIIVDMVAGDTCDDDFLAKADELYSGQSFILLLKIDIEIKIKLLRNNKVEYHYFNEGPERLFELMGVQ